MWFTPLDLEHVLADRLRTYAGDMIFKSPIDGGKDPVHITVYEGHVPSYQVGNREAPQLYPKAPAVAVKVSHGHYMRLDGVANVSFFIVIWDDDASRKGYKDVGNIMNRIVFGLQTEVIIAESFPLLDAPITYELIEDPAADYHPWYGGIVQAQFGIMSASPGMWIDPSGGYNDTGPDTSTVSMDIPNQNINITDPTANPQPPYNPFENTEG